MVKAYGVSFWNNKNVLKLIEVMVTQVFVLKAIELYSLNSLIIWYVSYYLNLFLKLMKLIHGIKNQESSYPSER